VSELLKGNYEVSVDTTVAQDEARSLTDEFEHATLARVGGSICFVRKASAFVWEGDDAPASEP
jgi:hypothetical protein